MEDVGSIIEAAITIAYSFENVAECDYDWIYEFDPTADVSCTKLLYPENFDRLSGLTLPLSYLFEHAPLIELLYRDERFFVVTQNLLTSFANHHFCMICAFQQEGHQMHPNHELPRWHVARALPRMEAAIVEATRAVEAILGKPGRRDAESKLARIRTRWLERIDLDPDDRFEVCNQTFLDYYYDLFGIRGDAAHSLGELPYELSRKLTMGECFAWSVMLSYLRKNALDRETPSTALQFNRELYWVDA